MGKVKDRRRAAKAKSLKARRVAKEGVPHNAPSRQAQQEIDRLTAANENLIRRERVAVAALTEIQSRSVKSRSGVAKAAHEIATEALLTLG